MVELLAMLQEHAQRMRAINGRTVAMLADWGEISRKMSALRDLRYKPPNVLEMVALSDRICERAAETMTLMERMQSLFGSLRVEESFSLMPKLEEMVGISESLQRQALIDVRRAWDSCIERN